MSGRELWQTAKRSPFISSVKSSRDWELLDGAAAGSGSPFSVILKLKYDDNILGAGLSLCRSYLVVFFFFFFLAFHLRDAYAHRHIHVYTFM